MNKRKSSISRKSSIWIGLVILLLVIGGSFAYQYFQSANQPPIVIRGYVGGEKINFLENPKVRKILKDRYRIEVDSNKAGSLDMVRANHTGYDFLFPSNQTALELYINTIGPTHKDDIIFNTPIVLYTHKLIADALMNEGLVTKSGEVFQIDMLKLVNYLKEGKSWADVGIPQLYGAMTVDTTDPAKSNSGNMFAGLVANLLNNGQVVTAPQVDKILPDLTNIFAKLGYMETSSSDLFSQFLKTGVGAKPIIAGYESQLLEFSKMEPAAWEEVKDDFVILYPVPTVWSTHILIALNAQGETLMGALKDAEIQKIAWEDHGFRTGVYGSGSSLKTFSVPGLAGNITQIIQMPSYRVMETIIQSFE